MTTHEELGRLIWETSRDDEGSISVTGADIIAKAILAAGYIKPLTIPDDHFLLDADYNYPVKYRVGTIVKSADGSVWRFDENEAWDPLGWGDATLRGPATILFEPEEDGE